MNFCSVCTLYDLFIIIVRILDSVWLSLTCCCCYGHYTNIFYSYVKANIHQTNCFQLYVIAFQIEVSTRIDINLHRKIYLSKEYHVTSLINNSVVIHLIWLFESVTRIDNNWSYIVQTIVLKWPLYSKCCILLWFSRLRNCSKTRCCSIGWIHSFLSFFFYSCNNRWNQKLPHNLKLIHVNISILNEFTNLNRLSDI